MATMYAFNSIILQGQHGNMISERRYHGSGTMWMSSPKMCGQLDVSKFLEQSKNALERLNKWARAIGAILMRAQKPQTIATWHGHHIVCQRD